MTKRKVFLVTLVATVWAGAAAFTYIKAVTPTIDVALLSPKIYGVGKHVIYRWHDTELPVTCWSGGQGISCIRDRELSSAQ